MEAKPELFSKYLPKTRSEKCHAFSFEPSLIALLVALSLFSIVGSVLGTAELLSCGPMKARSNMCSSMQANCYSEEHESAYVPLSLSEQEFSYNKYITTKTIYIFMLVYIFSIYICTI